MLVKNNKGMQIYSDFNLFLDTYQLWQDCRKVHAHWSVNYTMIVLTQDLILGSCPDGFPSAQLLSSSPFSPFW